MTAPSLLGPDALFRLELAVCSVLQPLTGVRATGVAAASVTGSSAVVLPPNTYGVPTRRNDPTGALYADFTRLVKSVGTPDGNGGVVGTTIAASATTPVPLVSVLGGVCRNLDPGTMITWYPLIPAGIAPTAVITAGLSGGADVTNDPVTGCPQVKQVLPFEGVGLEANHTALWKAETANFPAVVIVWEGSDEGRAVAGAQGRYLYHHRMKAYIVATRLDGSNFRRDEGKLVLTAVQQELMFRAAVDGEAFSAPQIKPGPMGRIAMDPGSYVYTFGFQVCHTHIRTERRTFNPLNSMQATLQIADPPVHYTVFNPIAPLPLEPGEPPATDIPSMNLVLELVIGFFFVHVAAPGNNDPTTAQTLLQFDPATRIGSHKPRPAPAPETVDFTNYNAMSAPVTMADFIVNVVALQGAMVNHMLGTGWHGSADAASALLTTSVPAPFASDPTLPLSAQSGPSQASMFAFVTGLQTASLAHFVNARPFVNALGLVNVMFSVPPAVPPLTT